FDSGPDLHYQFRHIQNNTLNARDYGVSLSGLFVLRAGDHGGLTGFRGISGVTNRAAKDDTPNAVDFGPWPATCKWPKPPINNSCNVPAHRVPCRAVRFQNWRAALCSFGAGAATIS